MPVGSSYAFIKVNNCVLSTNPDSILDLGIGYGMNGAGIRNWYSMGCYITGVEVFEQYRNAMWGCYDRVVIDDIINYLKVCSEYDMVIMTDVLEHFTKEDGVKVLDMISKAAIKNAVITTPAVWFEQGHVHGNMYEEHKSIWTVDDLKSLGWGIVSDGYNEFGHQMIIADYVKK
jgi:hypothetical protein